MGVIVRPAASGDFDAIARIVNAEIEGGVAHFGTEPARASELAAEWAGGSRHPWVVAVDEAGAILGYAKAGPWKSRGSYRWTVEIGVYVREGVQGQGLGRTLYESLFPELERRGFRTVIAGMTLPNEPSRRLHEAMGMRYIGTFPNNGYKHGAWRDVAYYALSFGSPGDAPAVDDPRNTPGIDGAPHQ